MRMQTNADPRLPPALRSPFLLAARLLAALGVVACATSNSSVTDHVSELVAHERFEEAVRVAHSNYEKHPGDARAEAAYKSASVAYLLEEGRRETLADRDEAALAMFEQAQTIEPDSRVVASWIDKTKRKMAERWLGLALEAHANSDLEAAMDAYQKALLYVPGDKSAVNGLATAVLQTNFRAGLGGDYFKQGLQALSQYWLDQARARFSGAQKYMPKDTRTTQRREQVDKLLSEQRVVVAKRLEGERHYAAARNEYRLAVALDPENEAAKEGEARLKKEARAAELMRSAKILTLRGKFDRANEELEKGRALTEAQHDLFDGARADMEQAVFEKHYQDALALERDLQFAAAVQAYTELLEKTPYYKDVLTRKDTLEQYIRLADELYAKYAAASTNAEKLDYLRQISVFWPEYKDTRARLEELEAAPR